METATLSELGRNVMLQFGAVSLALSTKTYEQRNSEDIERCRENIDAEQERFQLWAANLGLQTTGDRSLDYRVKDSASVKSYTKQLLEELGDDLVDLTKLLKEEPDESYTEQSTGFQEDEEDTDDEESRPCTDTELAEDDSDDTESENDSEKSASQDTGSVAPGATFEDIETMIDDISDIIDRLYRLASKLRNTATRAPPSARNFYREPLVDIDGSKFYLTSSERQTAKEQCEELHRQRIEELVRQSLRDECGDPFPKADNTPDLSSRTIAVIRRIAMANAYRQQQFAFWRSREWERRRAVKYQDTMIQPPPNLEEEELKMQEPMISPENKAPKRPTLEAPAKSRLVFSEVPSATWKMVKEPTLAALDETRSLSSKTEFTSSSTIYEPSGRKVGWPAFPKELGKKKDFICPYCFVTCPADYRGKGHWRAHLIQDLQPYTCLAENCQEGDSKLLNTWEEWIIHEQVHHRMEYSCPSHPEKTFPDRETYEYHVIQEHSNTRDELLTIDGCNNNANIAPRPRSGCPLCPYESDTWADLDKHLAYHLENLALLSLPLATGLERENVGMGSLQQEGGEDDAMNLLDEYVAGTLSNLFETECTEALEEIPSMPSEGLTQAALSKLPERNAGDEPTLRMLQNQDAPDDFHRFDPDTGVSPYDAMVPWDVEHIREIFPRASPTLTRRLAMANAKRRKRIDMIRARITQFRLLNKYDEATRERAILETKDPMLYGHFLAEAKRKFAKFGDVPGSNNKVTISDSFFQRLGGVQTHLSNFNGEDDVPGSVNLPTGEIFSSWDRESRSSKLKMKILEFAWISRHVTRFNKHYDVFRCPVCDSTLHDFSGRLASLDIISMLNHFKEYVAPYICVENGCESPLFSSLDDWATHMDSHSSFKPGKMCPLCTVRSATPWHVSSCLRRATTIVMPRLLCPWTDSEFDISGSTDGECTDEAFLERRNDFYSEYFGDISPLPEGDWDLNERNPYVDPEFWDTHRPVAKDRIEGPKNREEATLRDDGPRVTLTNDAIGDLNSRTTPVPILDSWLLDVPMNIYVNEHDKKLKQQATNDRKPLKRIRHEILQSKRSFAAERSHTTGSPPPSRRSRSESGTHKQPLTREESPENPNVWIVRSLEQQELLKEAMLTGGITDPYSEKQARTRPIVVPSVQTPYTRRNRVNTHEHAPDLPEINNPARLEREGDVRNLSLRRKRSEEQEELMMTEAIRLSVAAVEDRKKKEAKEAAKGDKKEEKTKDAAGEDTWVSESGNYHDNARRQRSLDIGNDLPKVHRVLDVIPRVENSDIIVIVKNKEVTPKRDDVD